MSLFGALDTAVSGLSSQSAAFSNISDDISNSQTVGYKGVNTAFEDYLTESNASVNDSGSTVAHPIYTNDVQGSITQSSNPLAMAISGAGFFPVSQVISNATSSSTTPTFSVTPAYTRTGDFSLNSQGYLVNSAGEYLNGYTVNQSTGVTNTSAIAPIQVNQSADSPIATSEVTLSANLPATPTAGQPVSSQITVYDALGTEHTLNLDWTQVSTNSWTVSINSPDDVTSTALGSATINFGTTSGNAVAAGTLGSIGAVTGSVASAGYTAGGPATLTFSSNFGSGAQSFTLNLGTYGGTTGLTQYAGTAYSLNGISQNGVPPGNYSSTTTTAQGDVVVNYTNGQSRTVAEIPLATFPNPDALQRQDGQAFTSTNELGAARLSSPGASGAGSLVTSSVEGSNVDIATQFTNLIVAQQAYSANTKVVTTANQMLQQAVNMIQ